MARYEEAGEAAQQGDAADKAEHIGALQLIPGVGRTVAWRSGTALRLAAFCGGVVLLAPASVQADAGVPMIAVLWPGFWVLLLPIVVLESVVARRVLGLNWLKAVQLSAEANLLSTLVGVPLTWGALVLIEMTALGLGGLLTQNPPAWLSYAMLPFMTPWLAPPSEDDLWVIPAAAAWMLVIMFFATVWLERRYVLWRTGANAGVARAWSWQANSLSYLIMEVLLVGRLAWLLFVG